MYLIFVQGVKVGQIDFINLTAKNVKHLKKAKKSGTVI
jgi:hypothetical protein